MIKKDLRKRAEIFYGSSSFGSLMNAAFGDGFRSVLLFRISNFFHEFRIYPLSYLFSELNYTLNRVKIGLGTRIGSGFVIANSNGIVINKKAVIGRNVCLEHQTTIGTRYADGKLFPVVGNDVFIGAGAKILGNVRIGNNAKIGANAVVLEDVPDNSTAIGIPAKILKKLNNPYGTK